MTRKESFGAVLRDLRIKAGFGLREFALKVGMQPSNLSFIENGRIPPPRKAESLEIIAHELGLNEKTDEWARFFDSASKEGEMPLDLRKNKNVRDFIPLLCRSVSAAKLTKEQILQLIDRVRTFKPKQ